MTPEQREKLKEKIADIISAHDYDRANEDDLAEKILQEVEKDFQILEVKKWAHYAGDI